MKTLLAIGVAAAILAPTAYAVGQARDPRVPGLQRKVATLQVRVTALESDVSQFETNYVNQNIDQRVLAFCDALKTVNGAYTPQQLALEPAFGSFLGAVTSEGSSTFACPS